MKLVACTLDRNGESILAILNDAIATSTALYDYEPRTMDQMRDWFDAKERHEFPVMGLVDDDEHLVGFATYGHFRAYAGYRHTVEHSVYVHREHRGRGYGLRMMSSLMSEAQRRGVHAMVGIIDAQNRASIAMHEKLGFSHRGTLREVGYKFDRWLDVVLYQLILGSIEIDQ